MPSIKVITPILGGRYYHIFNRGVNKQRVFFMRENYEYFLTLLDKYLAGYMHILAYCLLPNHFHLIVKVKDEISNLEYGKISSEAEIGKLTVRQLRSMFISYTMSVNIQEKRTGVLFESKYKRLEIETEEYLRYVIFYTHYNPEKHGIEENFKEYRFSSFRTFLSDKPTKIDRELVLNIYGDKSDFLNYHAFLHDEKEFVEIE